MNDFIDFILLKDSLTRNIIIGVLLLSISSSIVGVFTFLRKRALVGDAVSHAVLPGVCLAFLVQGTKNPFGLLLGAFITGWLSLLLIDLITSKTRIKEDTAIGLVLTAFFAFGTVLLSYIQNTSDSGNQGGLNSFLFGSVTSITQEDIYVFGGVAIVLILVTTFLFKEFFLLSFDESYARTIGFPVASLKLCLTTLTVFAVVIGIQAVGVVLMAAMLITPAAAARFWTDNLRKMILTAAVLAVVSSLGGIYISYESPSPTGPWMVMILSMMALLSFLFSPKKGIISKLIRQKRFRNQIVTENILKAIFQINERANTQDQYLSVLDIVDKRPMHIDQLKWGLSRLTREGFLLKEGEAWRFTSQGKSRGQRLTKLHRLWELYLTEKMNIAPDHVHDDAETIEHIITPELEEKLEAILNYPTKDPHDSVIPYKK